MSRRKVYEHNNPQYRQESINRLRNVFPPGAEVRTIVKHVSRSGMLRIIDVLAIESPRSGDGPDRIVSVGHDVARVLGWSYDNHHRGIVVDGCGMDMCFHVVYTLSRTLYGDLSAPSVDVGYLLDSRTL